MTDNVRINASGTMAPEFQIGKNGPTIYQGNSAPSGLIGNAVEGDLYIRTDVGSIYQLQATSWIRIQDNLSSAAIVAALGFTPLNAAAPSANANALTTARQIGIAGDILGSTMFDGSANATITATLTNSGVTSGTYAFVTVDAKGRITTIRSMTSNDVVTALGFTPLNTAQPSATANALTTARAIAITGDATGSVAFDGSANVAITTTLANSGVASGTYTKVTVDSKGRVTTGTTLSSNDVTAALGFAPLNAVQPSASANALTTARAISLAGDATGSVAFDGSTNVAITTTLANSGVTAGTYTKVTVDAKGRVTTGAALAANDVTAALGFTPLNATTPSASANALTTARLIEVTGDATGSASFDGSANVAIAATLANSGVVSGTYTKVTVDSKGRVTTGASLASNDVTTALGFTPLNTAQPSATANALTTARLIEVTGDATGSASFDGSTNVAITTTLAASGATAGTYGSATILPTITVDTKGRVTSIANTAISFPVTSVAGKTGAVSLVSADITDATSANTVSRIVARDGSGNFSAGIVTANLYGNANTATVLATIRTIALSGDATATGSFNGSANLTLATTLANSGVTAGTYSKVTVDEKGRVTVGNTISSNDVVTALGFTPITSVNPTFSTDVVFASNVAIQGTMITVDASTITIADPSIMLGNGSVAINDGKDRGLLFQYGTGGSVGTGFIGWDNSTGRFTFVPNATDTNGVISGAPGIVEANLFGNANTATVLATARTIALSGDATATGSFNGSANVTLATTLANSGVVSGTYTKVTVDAKGRVTTGAAISSSDVVTALGYTPINPAATGNTTVAAPVIFSNDVTVQGSFSTADGIVAINTDAVVANDGKDLGIQFNYGNNAAVKTGYFGFDNSTGYFTYIPDASISGDVVTGTQGTIAADLVGSVTGNASSATKLATARTVAISGDATASGSFDGSANLTLATTLASTGVAAGTYNVATITVDAKGRITAASNGTAVVTTANGIAVTATGSISATDVQSALAELDTEKLAVAGGTLTGALVFPAGTTSAAPVRIPHGSAPTSPNNGDIWTTTSGLFSRVNGTTLQLSDTTHTHAASAITSSATGNISATNVQAALAELDSEKAGLAGATFTGSIILPASSTSAPSLRIPHGAAPSTPTNGDIWTTTSGVFAHVNGSSLQLSDTTHVHSASVITSTATGNISATNVQAALAELDSEKLARTGGTMTGNLIISGSSLSVDAASGASTAMYLGAESTMSALYALRNKPTNALRWQFGKNTTAESGSNAGSDYVLLRYDDSGSYLGRAYEFTRSSGDGIFYGNVAISGKLTTSASTATRSGLNLPHGTAPTTPTNGDIWTTTSGLFARVNGATLQVSDATHSHAASAITSTATGNISATNVQAALAELDSEKLALAGGTMTGALVLPAGTTTEAPVRIPHGSTPTNPVDGDIWSTTAGLFTRVNGATIQVSGGGGGTSTASAVSLTATGSISATDVQGAIAELDAEKLALAGGTMTGALVLPAATTSTASVRIPHGSAPTTPNDGDIWTTTAGVFARVNGTSLQLSDTTHTHAASAITSTATGTVSATNVQAALTELDTEKLARAGGTMTGALVLPSSTTSAAPVRIPHGSAPTSPTNGDVWTTTSGLYVRINSATIQYAPLDGPAFTGVPTAPTATAGANTTQIATTAFVRQAVSDLVDSSPSTLDTLNELAAALGDDPNFATTVTNQIATKLSLSGGTMTGALTTTASVGSGSGLNLPHGSAPTSPVNGDIWTTTSGLFARVNGTTLQVSDTSHTHAASAITSTATGSISATNVQAALSELDTEKLALAGGTMTGALVLPAATTSTASVRIPHGSAPTAPTNGDIWTTTAGVFARVNGTSLQLSDTTHTHAASAITSTATGNIAATNVQAALTELDAEKLALTGGTMTGALAISGATLSVDAATGTASAIFLGSESTKSAFYSLRNRPDNTLRWLFGKNTTAESGSNTGSDYVLFRYDDSGSYLGRAFQFTRSSGDGIFDGNISISGKLTTSASTATRSGLNLPHGSAPTSPVNGDIWTTTSGVFARVNGASLQLSDATHAHAASAITSTATGNISATNVQAALAELDAEKLALTGGTMTGSLILPAGTTSAAPVRIPHGTAPTTATNGDLWSTTSGLFSQINGATAAFYPAMTSAEFRAKTANRTMENDAYWSALAPVTLTSASTIEIDFSTGVNFEVTLNGAQRLGAPSNLTPGQTGFLYVIQGSSGNCTLTYNTAWKFVGGTPPTLSTAANTIDRFFYFVRSSSHVDLIATTNMAGTNSVGVATTTVTSNSGTITYPSTVTAGSYAILVDIAVNTSNTTLPSLVVPTGFTDMIPAGVTDTGPAQGFRLVMSYMALTGTEGGTTITGMNSSMNQKALYIIKPEFVITSVSNTFAKTLSGNDPAAVSVTTTTGKANFSFAAQVGAGTTSPQAVTPTGYEQNDLNGGQAKFFSWNTDSSAAARTITINVPDTGAWTAGVVANIVFN